MRIALAQLNLLVGDVAGNAERVVETANRARDDLRADIVVFPELTLTGYPPEDLLLHSGLRSAVEHSMVDLRERVTGIAALVGFPEWDGDALYNSAALIAGGAVTATYRKRLLPNYAVFDEKRYFTPEGTPVVVEVAGVRLGLTICEDGWFPEPSRDAAAAGAEIILNLSASPFEVGRRDHRVREVFGRRARETGLPVVCVNLVGGQDELVFDGGSLVVAADGSVAVTVPAYEEALVVAEFDRDATGRLVPKTETPAAELGTEESIWNAIALGTRDYVDKNRFPGVLIGLSGGIDSALCATVATDALGADRVHTMMMPSMHTADYSVSDAAERPP